MFLKETFPGSRVRIDAAAAAGWPRTIRQIGNESGGPMEQQLV